MSIFNHANRWKIKYLPATLFEEIKRGLFLFLILFTYSSVRSQVLLPTSLSYVNGDYIIPTGINSLNIEAAGAQGGFAAIAETNFSGGKSVILKADFPVGVIECNNNVVVLKPGGKLRFVLGIAGGGENQLFGGQSVYGGGGGGTGVLYQPPGSTTWTLLLVAGGGGGGYATSLLGSGTRIGNNGGDAQTGGDGSKGGGNYGGNGGSGGSGGIAGGIIVGDGGGGGYIYNGDNGNNLGIGGQAGGTTGGSGGGFAGAGVGGGSGFGDGGSSIAAGGGGGYSDGGGGSADGYGGGGGGGSFIINGAQNVTKSVYIPYSGVTIAGSVFTSTVAGTLVLAPTRIFVNGNVIGGDGTS